MKSLEINFLAANAVEIVLCPVLAFSVIGNSKRRRWWFVSAVMWRLAIGVDFPVSNSGLNSSVWTSGEGRALSFFVSLLACI